MSRIDWHKTAEEIYPSVSDMVGSVDELKSIFRQIAKSGGLWHRKRDDREAWATAPFVAGMWEMNVDKIDAEFKAIHQEYGRSARIDAPIRRGDTRQMRVLPILGSLIPERRVAHYD